MMQYQAQLPFSTQGLSVFSKKNRKKITKKFGDIKNCRTFASELIERLIQNLYSLLVISFSVINYVVSMRVRT